MKTSDACLCCGLAGAGAGGWHPTCSRRFFGTAAPPALAVSLADVAALAARNVLERVTVTGVQRKLSLHLEKTGGASRLTIVGLWGGYILKPPVEAYPELPEIEHATLHLAEAYGIPCAPHGLIRLASGEFSFISRRMDRTPAGGKLAMEDFCQLDGRVTEDKYKGSLERCGKIIARWSSRPGLDAVDFWERAVFCWLTGNADMHLKNFSLLGREAGFVLAPAYDLVATTLVLPQDQEETALTLNGKKNKIGRADFIALGRTLGLANKAVTRLLDKAAQAVALLAPALATCPLTDTTRRRLASLIAARTAAL